MVASQPVAEHGVGTDQREAAEAKSEENEVEHGGPPLRDGGEMTRPS